MKHPLYAIWAGMKDRCSNSNRRDWHRYGGRGISVCERWLNFSNFAEDMGERPKGTSIDRINNDGNYEPNNCRWATHKEQCNNKSMQVDPELKKTHILSFRVKIAQKERIMQVGPSLDWLRKYAIKRSDKTTREASP